MKKLDKRLFRMIKKTKGQYIAVLCIIITGIFIFTAVNNSAINLKDTLNEYYINNNFADIFVSAVSIPESVEERLESENGIKQVELRLVLDTSFITEDKDERVNIRVVSVDKKENKINKLYVKQGKRELSEKDIIIIEQFAVARNINVGDTVKLKINNKQYKFNVKAIVSSPEFVYLMENDQTLLPNAENFGVMYIDENYLRKIAGTNGNFNEAIIKVENQDNLSKVADNLDEKMDEYGLRRVTEKYDQLSYAMLSQEIDGLEKMAQSLPIVFLIFAGIMLSSMLSRIVKNDRTSIGVLKALGYKSSEIIFHYLKYAASVGIVGGIIGSVIGTALSGAMTGLYLEYFNIPMLIIKVYYNRIIVSIFLSLLFCIISGFWGIKEIVKINPAESMKAEPPKQGKRILLENIKFIWNKVSFSWKMVLRSIFREKKKFIFIAAAVSITCSMMIMTFWMNDIMDVMFNKHYGGFMKMEYNIALDGFFDSNIKKEISKKIDPVDIEGRVEFPFEIIKEKQSKIVNIIGVEKSSIFYGFSDLKGNKVEIPDEGIVISSNLANVIDAKIGDKIFIKNFILNRNDDYVTVKGIIKQSFGINGYMNIDYLNKNFLDSNVINGVYVNSNDDVLEKLHDIKHISSIQSQQDMKSAFEEFTGLMALSIGTMIIFSGILGFVIVYSMTLMSINERTLEFSSLRVMGFSKGEIFNMLVKENMIMSIIGIIFGIPMGAWLTDIMGKTFTTDIYTMSEPLSLNGIILAIALTIVFLILAQFMTYAKIHKLDFMQALKNRVS